MKTEAYLSESRRYRYWLLRVWDESLPIYCSIGVNPSTADESVDDPTIRKDVGFGKKHGYGGLLKLNVGAYRSTDPKAWRKSIDPIGPENSTKHMLEYIAKFRPDRTIAAWGKNGNYQRAQCAAIARDIPDLWCFGCNPDGTPRHTLMLPYSTELVRWNDFRPQPAMSEMEGLV